MRFTKQQKEFIINYLEETYGIKLKKGYTVNNTLKESPKLGAYCYSNAVSNIEGYEGTWILTINLHNTFFEIDGILRYAGQCSFTCSESNNEDFNKNITEFIEKHLSDRRSYTIFKFISRYKRIKTLLNNF